MILAPVSSAAFWPKGTTPTMARTIVGLDSDLPLLESEWSGGRVVARDEKASFVVVEHRAGQPFGIVAQALPGVRYVERDAEDALTASMIPNDPRFPEQTHLSRIRAPQAWDLGLGSTSVVIAILDTGVDTSHPDLGRLLPGIDLSRSGTLQDVCSHGTHVTGIAAATTGNGIGVAGIAQVSVLPVKVLGNRCSGSFSDVASGITWAADRGARVISMSLGCQGCTSQAVIDAVDYAVGKGALVVAAAGNNGPCGNCVQFPANLASVVAVGCTDSADVVCSFSTSGAQLELAAPGHTILSTVRGGGYGSASGTSMSTPMVAGVAGLVLSREPTLTGAQVRERLAATARDVGSPGRDASTGVGVVDARAALGGSAPAGTPPVARFSDSVDGLGVEVDARASSDADGRIVSWSWDWGDASVRGTGAVTSHAYATAGAYTVTLTVTDDDGLTAEASALIRVTSPSGALIWEDFDDGEAQGWTLTGLWRVASDCLGSASPTRSLQYNRAGACTYETGSRTSGAASFAVDTSARASPVLSFRHKHTVESYASGSYDRMQVQVSMNGGASWTVLLAKDSRSASLSSWTEETIDLSAYRSPDARIRFAFDTIDRVGNAHPGWGVDDVRVG